MAKLTIQKRIEALESMDPACSRDLGLALKSFGLLIAACEELDRGAYQAELEVCYRRLRNASPLQ